jgi:putative protease
MMADHGLYSLNGRAKEQLLQMGITRTTASVELNETELLNSNMEHCELIGYGYLPMMVTANCLCKTLVGCQKSGGDTERRFELADDRHRRFPVLVDCMNCMNTILNCAPLYLLDYTRKLEMLAPESIRLIFTVENREEVHNILLNCRGEHQVPENMTRGHLKRGVE